LGADERLRSRGQPLTATASRIRVIARHPVAGPQLGILLATPRTV